MINGITQATADAITAQWDADGWWNGRDELNGPGQCLLTATVVHDQPTQRALAAACAELFGDRVDGHTGVAALLAVNDHRDTTEEDIRKVVQYAVLSEEVDSNAGAGDHPGTAGIG